MTTFIDTNVLIYLLDERAPFHQWSVSQLQSSKASGPVIISDIVYCEFCVGMASQAHVDAAVSHFGLQRLRGNDLALFRAAMAYKTTCEEEAITQCAPRLSDRRNSRGGRSAPDNRKPEGFSRLLPKLQVISPTE